MCGIIGEVSFKNNLTNSKKFKDCNFINSILVNSTFVLCVVPSILFKQNGTICKYWFFSLIIVYLIIYLMLQKNIKKNPI